MNQIILASHGGLAAGAKDTLEMVLGDVSNVHVVSLARDDKEPITNKVDAMIATFNADDTVYVLTDMLGSSVNNSMVELSKNGTKFTVVSGFNIPLALTLAMSPAPIKGAELAALINEARTGLTNPNAPVEAAAAPAKKAKASRHSSGPAKIVLARLDYRLLHGQVVFTWTTKVQAERIIVVDNAAANDDIKKGALKLAKPQGVRLNVFTVERALAKMDKLNTLGERVMFVLATPPRCCSSARATSSTPSTWAPPPTTTVPIRLAARTAPSSSTPPRRPTSTSCSTWASSSMFSRPLRIRASTSTPSCNQPGFCLTERRRV